GVSGAPSEKAGFHVCDSGIAPAWPDVAKYGRARLKICAIACRSGVPPISIFTTNSVACTMIKAAVDIWIAHTRGAIRILGLAVVCVMIATTASAQQNVKLEHADQLSFERDKGYQKLTGNVVFTQNQTTIYCDSAYLYKEQNSVEAFGRVRITEGDSV